MFTCQINSFKCNLCIYFVNGFFFRFIHFVQPFTIYYFLYRTQNELYQVSLILTEYAPYYERDICISNLFGIFCMQYAMQKCAFNTWCGGKGRNVLF